MTLLTADNLVSTHAWSRTWLAVFIPFLVTRILLSCIGLYCVLQMPDQIQPDCKSFSAYPLVNIWAHWDAKWYLSIARDGYQFVAGEQCNVAFAPLYPMLMRVLAMPFGSSDDSILIAGIAVSNISLLISLYFLTKIVQKAFPNDKSESIARRACLYVLICPGTIFLSAVYPMSLFLAIACATMWYAMEGRWRLAIAIACLAPLARPDGALILIPLIVERVHQSGTLSGKRLIRELLALSPIVLASLIWPAFLYFQFGDPILFIRAQAQWHPSPFWTVFHSSRAWLFLGLAGLFVILTGLSFFKLRPSLAVYGATFLLMMLSAARFWSIVRFLVILFPAFVMLAWLGKYKVIHILVTVASFIIAACLMARFALGFWVA